MYVRHTYGTQLGDSVAVVAAQIVCEAESWLGSVEVPVGSNAGGRIDEIHAAYRGADWASKLPASCLLSSSARAACLAYCAEWVWVVAENAIRALGGTNRLPGWGVTFANALATLNGARSAGLVVDKTPAVGSVFFRTSTGAIEGGKDTSGASGHMGIVVGWDGATLHTIEANQGNTHAVLRFQYPATIVGGSPVFYASNGRDWGFQFIHVERTSVTASANVGKCAKAAQADSGSGYTNTRGRIVGTSVVPQGSAGSGATTSGGASSGGAAQDDTSQVVESKRLTFTRDQCVNELFDVRLENIRHYSYLKDPLVASDIVGATLDASANWYRKRNGAAVNRLSGSDRNEPSGVGLFTDRNGNIIWVTQGDSGQHALLSQYGLWGPSPDKTPGQMVNGMGNVVLPIVFTINRDSTINETAGILTGQRPFRFAQNPGGYPDQLFWTDASKSRFERVNPTDTFGRSRPVWGTHTAYRREYKGRTFFYSSVNELLQQIEAIGRPLDAPVLVRIVGSAFTINDFVKGVGELVQFILKAAAPFARHLPELDEFIKSDLYKNLQQASEFLAGGGAITLATGMQHLAPLVKTLAPGIAQEYVDRGMRVWGKYQEIGSGRLDIEGIADTLGVDIAAVKGSLNDLLTDSGVQTLYAGARTVFDDVRNNIRALTHAHWIEEVRKFADVEGNHLYNVFKQSGEFFVRVPAMRDIIIAGSASGLLPTVPNISAVMSVALRKGKDKALQLGENNQALSVVAGLALTGLGIVPHPETYTQLAYDAIARELGDLTVRLGNQLKAYTLPASVPERHAAEFANRLEQCFKIPVIVSGTRKPTYSGATTSGGGGTFTDSRTIVDYGRSTAGGSSTVTDSRTRTDRTGTTDAGGSGSTFERIVEKVKEVFTGTGTSNRSSSGREADMTDEERRWYEEQREKQRLIDEERRRQEDERQRLIDEEAERQRRSEEDARRRASLEEDERRRKLAEEEETRRRLIEEEEHRRKIQELEAERERLRIEREQTLEFERQEELRRRQAELDGERRRIEEERIRLEQERQREQTTTRTDTSTTREEKRDEEVTTKEERVIFGGKRKREEDAETSVRRREEDEDDTSVRRRSRRRDDDEDDDRPRRRDTCCGPPRRVCDCCGEYTDVCGNCCDGLGAVHHEFT